MAENDPHEATQKSPGDLIESSADAAPASPDVESSERPERIGRYRIEKVLGKGGFGLVYLAYDEQLDRPVAVKVPHAKLISQPEDAEAYLAEARTVANLDHPHIVPVYDVGSTETCPVYVVSKFERFLTPSSHPITPPIPPGACACFCARLIAWVCWPATVVQTSDGFVTAQGFFYRRLFSQSELASLSEFLIQFCYDRR